MILKPDSYVPLLRWRQAEYQALMRLRDDAKDPHLDSDRPRNRRRSERADVLEAAYTTKLTKQSRFSKLRHLSALTELVRHAEIVTCRLRPYTHHLNSTSFSGQHPHPYRS